MTNQPPHGSPITSRRVRTILCLLAVATLGVATACDDQSFRPQPLGPTPPAGPPAPSTVYYTAPVEGVVREVGGGPLAGQAVRLQGLTGNHSTVADAAGRFQFESVEISPDRYPQITAYREGYVTGTLAVPWGFQTPEPLFAELRLQPQLTLYEGAPLRITLSNEDLDYGASWEPGYNLPGERGPVKVIIIESATDGPHTLRAEWSTADRLHLWAEINYLEESFEASGHGSATVLLPYRWTRQPRNPVTVTVGLPRSARATGGVHGVITVTLTLGPAYAAP